MDLGPHAVFIVGAYAGVIVATLAIIGYVIWDARRTTRRLADLDARGVSRRSAKPAAAPAKSAAAPAK